MDFNSKLVKEVNKINALRSQKKEEFANLIHAILIILLQILMYSILFTQGLEYVQLRFFLILIISLLNMQIFYIGHDAGHESISSSSYVNKILGHISIAFFCFGSFSYWKNKHNNHHINCNKITDIDVNSSIFRLYKSQTKSKLSEKLFVRFQHYLLWLIYPVYWIEYRRRSLFYAWRYNSIWEFDLYFLLCHIFAFLILPSTLSGWESTILNYFFIWSLTSIIIMPFLIVNHVGMPVLEENGDINSASNSFVRDQIVTSRNIIVSPIFDFLWGGLNYQIEHHLFPKMTTRSYRKIAPTVKKICSEFDVNYEETSFLEALSCAFSYLEKMSKI